MDRTLMALMILGIFLIGMMAPYATLNLVIIVSLVVLSTWGSWVFVRGWGEQWQSNAQPERIWD